MCHPSPLSRKPAWGECRQQKVSSCQLLQALPQLQKKNSLLQSHTLPGVTTSCHWASQGLKGPGLASGLAEALFGLHHRLSSPFCWILFPLPSFHKHWSLINTLHPQSPSPSQVSSIGRQVSQESRLLEPQPRAGLFPTWLVVKTALLAAGGAQQTLARGNGPAVCWWWVDRVCQSKEGHYQADALCLLPEEHTGSSSSDRILWLPGGKGGGKG